MSEGPTSKQSSSPPGHILPLVQQIQEALQAVHLERIAQPQKGARHEPRRRHCQHGSDTRRPWWRERCGWQRAPLRHCPLCGRCLWRRRRGDGLVGGLWQGRLFFRGHCRLAVAEIWRISTGKRRCTRPGRASVARIGLSSVEWRGCSSLDSLTYLRYLKHWDGE